MSILNFNDSLYLVVTYFGILNETVYIFLHIWICELLYIIQHILDITVILSVKTYFNMLCTHILNSYLLSQKSSVL